MIVEMREKTYREVLGGAAPTHHYPYGIEHFVLDTGQFWELPQAELPPGVPRMLPKQCFDNAYQLAKRKNRKLRFVEGFAIGLLPVHHAWVVTEENFVIEATWPPHLTGTAYFGTVFSLATVRRSRTAQNLSVLLDLAIRGFPDRLTRSEEEVRTIATR
jgi:hypothetical protein